MEAMSKSLRRQHSALSLCVVQGVPAALQREAAELLVQAKALLADHDGGRSYVKVRNQVRAGAARGTLEYSHMRLAGLVRKAEAANPAARAAKAEQERRRSLVRERAAADKAEEAKAKAGAADKLAADVAAANVAAAATAAAEQQAAAAAEAEATAGAEAEAHRVAAEQAVVAAKATEKLSKATDGNRTRACGHFRMDLGGSGGTCRCGFKKTAHTAAALALPAASPSKSKVAALDALRNGSSPDIQQPRGARTGMEEMRARDSVEAHFR